MTRGLRGAGLRSAGLVLLWIATAAWGEVRDPDGVAVIVGNRTYEREEVPEAAYAQRDAAAFKRYVTDVLGFDRQNVIGLTDAGHRDLVWAFGNERSHEGELWAYLDPAGGSDVAVFYSGHGVPGADGRGYLLPSDGDPDRPELTGYPLDLLYANLAKLEEARTVVVYLEASFSGDSHAGMLVQAESPIAYAPAEPPAKVTVLAASSGAEVASWDEEARHGLFTNHLLDALYGGGDADSDGRVTAGEAHEYLSRHVALAARRTYRRRQNPTLTGPAETVVASAVAGAFPERPALETATAAALEPAAQNGPPQAAMPPGRTFRDCEECPEMVVVPAGSFLMGSPPSEQGRDEDEGPRRRVTIAAPFAVGVYEVTRGEYERYVTASGQATDLVCRIVVDGQFRRVSGVSWRAPGFLQGDAEPVVCVNWEEAQAYVRWLSRRTGQEYRLPSEAEWEYVARGGADTARHWGDGQADQCRYANGADAAAKRRHRGWTTAACDDRHYRTAPAGSFLPNRYGVHDVLGNVREWTADCGNAGYEGAPGDGSAWEQGDCGYRAVRGGAWHSAPEVLRSANRSWGPPGHRNDRLGFRVARTL